MYLLPLLVFIWQNFFSYFCMPEYRPWEVQGGYCVVELPNWWAGVFSVAFLGGVANP